MKNVRVLPERLNLTVSPRPDQSLPDRWRAKKRAGISKERSALAAGSIPAPLTTHNTNAT